MLTAKKNRLFEKIFAVYNRNLLKRRFHSMSVAGIDFLQSKNPKIPLLIYANHTSWWDGLLAFEISRTVDLDSYIMMEEANLERFFLFRFLGAFSVSRNPRSAIESISYSAKLLTEKPNSTLWIFPQGEIVRNDFRPIRFYKGAAKIVEKVGKCLTVSLAFRLEFTGEFKPEIFIKIGEPEIVEIDEKFNPKLLTEKFAEKTTALLDSLRDDVINKKTSDYQKLF